MRTSILLLCASIIHLPPRAGGECVSLYHPGPALSVSHLLKLPFPITHTAQKSNPIRKKIRVYCSIMTCPVREKVEDGFQEMKKETEVFPYSIRARLGIKGFWSFSRKKRPVLSQVEGTSSAGRRPGVSKKMKD